MDSTSIPDGCKAQGAWSGFLVEVLPSGVNRHVEVHLLLQGLLGPEVRGEGVVQLSILKLAIRLPRPSPNSQKPLSHAGTWGNTALTGQRGLPRPPATYQLILSCSQSSVRKMCSSLQFVPLCHKIASQLR